MKPQFNFEKPAEAETCGVLALRSKHRLATIDGAESSMTSAQLRAFAEVAQSLLVTAKAAGAGPSPVIIENLSFRLEEREDGSVLSIQTLAK